MFDLATTNRYGQGVAWEWEVEFARARARQEWVRAVGDVFADKFRQRRVSRGMSQEHVAHTMALIYGHRTWRQATVANVESKKRDVRLVEAVALAEIVECSLWELLGELGETPDPIGMQLREVELDGERPEEA